MTRCFALLKMRLWRQAVFCVCPSLATVEKSHPQKGNEGGDKKTKTSKEVNKKRPPSIRSHFDRFATDDSVSVAHKAESLSTFPFSCTPRLIQAPKGAEAAEGKNEKCSHMQGGLFLFTSFEFSVFCRPSSLSFKDEIFQQLPPKDKLEKTPCQHRHISTWGQRHVTRVGKILPEWYSRRF